MRRLFITVLLFVVSANAFGQVRPTARNPQSIWVDYANKIIQNVSSVELVCPTNEPCSASYAWQMTEESTIGATPYQFYEVQSNLSRKRQNAWFTEQAVNQAVNQIYMRTPNGIVGVISSIGLSLGQQSLSQKMSRRLEKAELDALIVLNDEQKTVIYRPTLRFVVSSQSYDVDIELKVIKLVNNFLGTERFFWIDPTSQQPIEISRENFESDLEKVMVYYAANTLLKTYGAKK